MHIGQVVALNSKCYDNGNSHVQLCADRNGECGRNLPAHQFLTTAHTYTHAYTSPHQKYTHKHKNTQDYADKYTAARDAYITAAEALKLATGPYKASRDAYVAATATYTKTMYD